MAAVKKGDTVVLVGTRKGLFLFHSRDRKRWSSRGPYFEGDTIRHAILDPDKGKTVFGGVTSEHWGPVVARSTDFGGKWSIEGRPAVLEGVGNQCDETLAAPKRARGRLVRRRRAGGTVPERGRRRHVVGGRRFELPRGPRQVGTRRRRAVPSHNPPVPRRFQAH